MSLIVVGSVAYDGVETPHGKVDRMLGGAATYIALSAAYFTQVKIVAVVGDDFAQEDTDLLVSRGIDLGGLERVPGGKSFFWAGKYSPDMNDRETLRTDLNVFADFDPKLPDNYRTEPFLFLGNIQPELQRSVRAQMRSVKLTGGDTMNYWIADFRAQLLETLKQWDFLLINDSEARQLSGETNLRRAAARILDLGPHTLVINASYELPFGSGKKFLNSSNPALQAVLGGWNLAGYFRYTDGSALSFSATNNLSVLGYGAKFATPYLLATGFVHGGVGLGAFTEAAIRDSQVLALAAKVKYVIDPQNPYPNNYTGHLRATMKDGSVIEERQPHMRGGAQEPLTRQDVADKFALNAQHGGWDTARSAATLTLLAGLYDGKIDLSSLRG
jgi:hypothetical protein